MITTRQVNVDLTKEKLKLRHVSTKDIDARVKVEPPKEPIKSRGVSTTTLPDVADIMEKKRRDDIAAEKKLAMKDEKKLIINEKGEANKGFTKGDAVYQKKEKVEKKSWKEMTNDEKKVVYKERAKRAAATRAAKKKK